MQVIGRSMRDDPERAAACGVEVAARDDVFRRADVVSLHLRATPETFGFVGPRELFELMPPWAILINTARGALVDEAALAHALRLGRIAGAGLDVFTREPQLPADTAFRQLDNVILTPHAGSGTAEARARLRTLSIDNVIPYFEDRPQHVVNAPPRTTSVPPATV